MRIIARPDDTGWAPAWARWSAIDDDSYEGRTPDEPGSPIGQGPTRQAAIEDLLEKLAEEADPVPGMCPPCLGTGVVFDHGSVFSTQTRMCLRCAGKGVVR